MGNYIWHFTHVQNLDSYLFPRIDCINTFRLPFYFYMKESVEKILRNWLNLVPDLIQDTSLDQLQHKKKTPPKTSPATAR